MKAKIFLFISLITLCFFISCSKDDKGDPTPNIPDNGVVINQEEAKNGYMILFTEKDSTDLTMNFEAEEVDQADVWMDLNNDGKKQENEKINDFGNDKTYTLSASTVTIYGKVTRYYCDEELTGLDVSKNLVLEKLYCGYNRLTSLDVTKNLVLEALYCEGNQLTSLDISKNRHLKVLCIWNNKIKKTAMKAILNALPDRTKKGTAGKVELVNETSKEEENELPDATKLIEVMKKNWEISPALSCLTIDGEIKPVLSTELVQKKVYGGAEYYIQFYVSEDKEEFVEIALNNSLETEDETIKLVEGEGHDLLGIMYKESNKTIFDSRHTMFKDGTLFINRLGSDTDAYVELKVELKNGKIKDNKEGDGKEHVVNLYYKGKVIKKK